MTEREHHRRAFEAYYDLGRRRSLGKLAKKLGRPISSIKLWSREFNWQERLLERERDVALAMQLNDTPLHFVARHGGLTFNPNDVEEPLRAIAADVNRSESLWRPK